MPSPCKDVRYESRVCSECQNDGRCSECIAIREEFYKELMMPGSAIILD